MNKRIHFRGHYFYILLIVLVFACTTATEQDTNQINESFHPETIIGKKGYFRVGQTNSGQWWFITPDDQPFFYKGVCAVNRAGTPGGRRARDGAYAPVVDRKYDYQTNPDIFVNAQIKRLRDWGFNAFGAWTTEEFFDQGMPYTEILEFFKEGPILTLPGNSKGMPDIFDPAWVEAINSKARTLCAPKRYSKELVGYFTDNEIGFGQKHDFGLDLGFTNAGRFGFSLLRSFLGMPEGIAAREFAWNFVTERYKNLDGLSQAWEVTITAHSDLKKFNEQKLTIASNAYQTDAIDFQRIYAETYFRLTYETIKRYDPNHLVMGCRFGAPPDTTILGVMKPWVDVISQNNYRPSLYQRIDYLYTYAKIPILIGEFSWNPDLFKYVQLPDEPAEGYSVKERVFRRGEQVLLRASTHPAMVGYTWYRWVANVTNGDRFSFGLVDKEDNEEMHIPLLRAIHPKIEPLRQKIGKVEFKQKQINSGELAVTLENMRPGWSHDLNYLLKDGTPQPNGHGWQMNAEIIDGQMDLKECKITTKVAFKEWYWREKLAAEAGQGEYIIHLKRNGDYLIGEYSGTYNGTPVSGKAHGYFLPELPVEMSAYKLFE